MADNVVEKYFFGFCNFFGLKKDGDKMLSSENQNYSKENTILYIPGKIKLPDLAICDATSLTVTWANLFCLNKGKVIVCGWKKDGHISAQENVSLPLTLNVVRLSASWNKLLLITDQGKCHVIWDLYNDWTMCEVTSDDTKTFSFGCLGDSHCVVVDTTGVAYEIRKDESDTKNRILCERISLAAQVDQVCCGKEHLLMLNKKFGTIYSFGLGSRGQLGLGQLTPEKTPQLVEALAGIRIGQIACGGWHSVALSECGDLYAWGWNDCGQLGITCVPPEVPMSFYTLPYIVDLPVEEWVRITWIGCGSRHTVAMTSQSNVYTWGWGSYGQLGHGDTENRHTPTLVEYFRSNGSKVSDVVCGPWQTVVFTETTKNDETQEDS